MLKHVISKINSKDSSNGFSLMKRFIVPFRELTKTFQSVVENKRNLNFYLLSSFFVTSCGGASNSDKSKSEIGFSSSYQPPMANFVKPNNIDPDFMLLDQEFVFPYWVNSLQMYNSELVINTLLETYDREIYFAFPEEEPSYELMSISGWASATSEMKIESRKIFLELEKLLDIKFSEIDDIDNFNVIAISQSVQKDTAGYSYFPSNFYEIGSDIYISKDYSSPSFTSRKRTNYDYEVLVHEIGHALGLKHPFEAHLDNLTTLNSFEDNSEFTVMSYNTSFSSFNGTFRDLDWMTLTKIYGVNPNFNPEDNIYEFSSLSGLFIIDGGGLDQINAVQTFEPVHVNLRPGSHSYIGDISDYITAPKQLTISHGSEIENVSTGSGNDYIIGNDLSNLIETSFGDDKIFAGEGEDMVDPGAGSDIIDFSEIISVTDTLYIDENSMDGSTDLVYGFSQGNSGDVIDISSVFPEKLSFLPLVDYGNVPIGVISNCIVRVFGKSLQSNENIELEFSNGGALESLVLPPNEFALMIFSNSQATGEKQILSRLNNNNGKIESNVFVELNGNYLDIDVWTPDNFILGDTTFLA